MLARFIKYKVLIAGAGQLGSRYLQGLSKLSESTDIWVFDLSAESLARAEQRWNEMPQLADHFVNYTNDLSTLPKVIDLAIVATTADVRTMLIKNIMKHTNIRNWVLEKVLAQNVAQILELEKMLGRKNASWVNTPMHMWPLYRNLRQTYQRGMPIDAIFEGFRGLACNAIHYIDFVSRWNHANILRVDVSGLKSEWYPAKRNGFYEVDGEILINFSDGSKLKIISEIENLSYKVTLRIGQDEWNVSEVEGKARATDGRSVEGTIEFQSQLTAPMATAIFSGESCGLPTLEQSAHQHTMLLSALLEHWNTHMPEKVDRLPIT